MSEAQIAAEIDALRLRHTETRELYREVCALLFFRYGITPTANSTVQRGLSGESGTRHRIGNRHLAVVYRTGSHGIHR